MTQVKASITQWQLLQLAISFLTRIPITLRFEVTGDHLNQASRYFALVGLGLGLVHALVFYCLQFILPVSMCVLLVLALSLLMTGAFHEDGWADVWDGFGGGWQVSQKLNIMKDSRLGTYGAAALIIILLLKYQSLVILSDDNGVLLFAIIAGQCLSRVVATSIIFSMDYVSEDASAKVKPLAMHLSKTSLVTLLLTAALLFAATLILQLVTWQALGIITLALVFVRLMVMHWFKRQLGGYTGDCLGAAQQLSELSIYITLIVSMTSTAQ
ncbi:adenosylcobinamide-GDP ribazoletransferase [Pseudoalteromonas sp. SaAl2]